MTLTDNARENYDALFPDHTSTLAGTDPELDEVVPPADADGADE